MTSRWLASGFVAATLAMLTGCGSPECPKPITPGQRFRVTVLDESPASGRCHIVPFEIGKVFEVTAGELAPLPGPDNCMDAVATEPPPVDNTELEKCVRKPSLVTECEFKTADNCRGLVAFSIAGGRDRTLDWSQSVLEGALYRINTYSENCPARPWECMDEYVTRVEHIQ